MASGQSPTTHCIPALVPIVEDIFLARSSATTKNPTDQRELETTREVLMTTLLRLIEYPQIIELLARCIAESRYDGDGNGEDKWRRWSRMATDTILPMLASRKIRIEIKDADIALMKLFSAVSPTVFRPVDPLLKVLFVVPPEPEESGIKLKRWLGMVNIVLLSLIAYAKEEAMLARLSDLSVYMTDLAHTLKLPENYYGSADPLNATNVDRAQIAPENILAIFIFRVVELVASRLQQLLRTVNYRKQLLNITQSNSTEGFLVHQLAFFLQISIHMFESGSHCKVANVAMQMIRSKDSSSLPIAELNSLMLEISSTCPLITCHWAYLLTLLDYSQVSFWSEILAIRETVWSSQRNSEVSMKIGGRETSINTRIVREAGTILFCDHVCENLNDAELLTWLLVNHIEETINLATESPVRELVNAAVHRNSAASGLLIAAISARALDLTRPSFVKRLLQCMEGAHHSQSGAVILALVPRFISFKHLALSRLAAKIASRRAEILLASIAEDALEQLPRDDLQRLMETLRSTKLARKHGTLVGLMNKLAAAWYDLSPLELEHSRPFNPSTIKNIQLDRQWYFSQVKLRCCHPCVSSDLPESAQLLGALELEDCDAILGSNEFDLKILVECVRLGAGRTAEEFRERELSGMEKLKEPVAIYKSARQCILRNVQNINEILPKPHQIYDPGFVDSNGKMGKYAGRFSKLLEDEIYRETLFTIIPAVTAYVASLQDFEILSIEALEEKYEETLAKFALLCLETSHWMLESREGLEKRNLKPQEFELALSCTEELLRNEKIAKVFGREKNYSWICSSARTLVKLVDYWMRNNGNALSIETENLGLSEALANQETKIYARACLEMSALISWLEMSQVARNKESANNIPEFVLKILSSLIVRFGRQPLVNSFVLTPPLAWVHGWNVVASGLTKTEFPLILTESNFLLEVDVLQQFIFRVTLLGWTSRLQFEEMWMALLSVLSVSPEGNDPEDSLQSQVRWEFYLIFWLALRSLMLLGFFVDI